MTWVLPSVASGRWGLAVLSRREPSKPSLLHPFPRGKQPIDVQGFGWFFPERGSPPPPTSSRCPPPRLARGPGSSGAPRGALSLWWLSAWAPDSRAPPRQPRMSIHGEAGEAGEALVVDEETARRGSEGGQVPGRIRQSWGQGPLEPNTPAPADQSPSPPAPDPQVSSTPRLSGQPRCPHLDLVGKGQRQTPRSRRFFWFIPQPLPVILGGGHLLACLHVCVWRGWAWVGCGP